MRISSDDLRLSERSSEALIEKCRATFYELLGRYKKEVVLRLLIQLLFPAWGPFDSLLGKKDTDFYQDRVLKLFETIIRDVSNLEEEAVRKQFICSEEFLELLGSCVDTVARTASRNKRRYVAAFLSGTIRQATIHDLSQQIAEDLKVLQNFHLHLLALLPNHLKKTLTSTRLSIEIIDIQELQEHSHMDWGIFNKGMSDLERLGFVGQISIGATMEEGSIMVFRPTKYFEIFKDFLPKESSTDNDDHSGIA